MCALIVYILTLLLEEAPAPYVTGGDGNREEYLLAAMEYVRTHFARPITAAEIAQVRPQAGNILNALLKRNLIETVPGETPDAPPVYRTTDRLLKILGINAITDLPIVDELDYR